MEGKRFMFDLQRFEGEGDGESADTEPTITEVKTKEELTTALNTGGTVKLLADITLSEALTISQNATLDLNGYTINATTTATPITITGGTFTLKDTSADANGKITTDSTDITIKVSGTSTNFVMTSGTVENTKATSNNYTVRIGGKAEIQGGEIKGTYGALRLEKDSEVIVTGANTKITAESKYPTSELDHTGGKGDANDGDAFGIVVGGSAKLIVGTEGDTTGPTITAKAADGNTQGEAVAIGGNGTKDPAWEKSNITVLSGTLSATGGGHNNLGIYNPSVDSELTIKGGTIKGGDETRGGTGVEVRAAKSVNVTGGEIIGVGSGYFTAKGNNNGSTSKGAGLAIAQHNTAEAITVNIRDDAKVSGPVALSVTNPNNRTSNEGAIELNVTGGEFEGTEAAVFYQDSRSELDVTDGNFKGAVVTTSKTESGTNNIVIAQAGEDGATDAALTTGTGEETTTTVSDKVKFTGGTYNSQTIENYTKNTSNSDNTAVWDSKTKTYSVANKGAGWTAKDAENKIFDYLINSGGKSQTLLAVSLTSALSAADSVSYLKADSLNRVLGVKNDNNVSGTSLNADLNEELTGKYSWLKFTTGSAKDVTITPQVAGVKIVGTDIVGDATLLATESLTGSDTTTSAITVSGADNSLANISGSVGDDSIVAADKRNTTINGGAGDDIIRGGTGADSLFGGAGNDKFYYSSGADTIADFGDQDQVILDGQTVITDGSKITSKTDSFTLDFGKGNTLTFQKVNEALPTVSVASNLHYVYTKDWVMQEGNSVTLASGVTNFDGTQTGLTSVMTVDGSGVSGNLTITDSDAQNNYIVMGSNKNKTTFNYKSGNDVIAAYNYGTDVVSLSGAGLAAPPTSFDNVSITSSDYAISLGTSNSLTFKLASEIELTKGSDTYTYKRDRIAWEDNGITLGAAYSSKTFNGNSDANSAYVSINAADVNHALRITGNGNNNLIVGGSAGGTLLGGDGADSLVATGSIGAFLNGGDGADSLVGGTGADTFAYTGGNDVIKDYDTNDLVSVAAGIDVAGANVSISGDNLILDFDGSKLTFEGGKTSTISLKSGRRDYLFSANSIASGNSITLTANYTPGSGEVFNSLGAYNTVDAALVAHAISITGNNEGNYIIGGTSGGSLFGGDGNDTLVGGAGKDKFRYTAGKDVIIGFDGAADSLSIATDNIDKARASSRRLTFTMSNKDNTLVFRSDDSIPPQISLTDGGYLTADGVVKPDKSLKLFSSAKGRIDLNDTLYSAASITAVDASTVKSQSVTLVGGSQGGAFIFAGTNKKRDGFEYGGGAVSISGYEAGKDRINLLNESISGFSINGDDVMISLGGDSSKYISLDGAQGKEVMIHQSTSRGNSYSRMVFAETGVLYDKAKATSATLSTDAGSFNVEDDDKVKSTLRKIIVGAGVENISITAGNSKNTQINASDASGAVSLVSGDKNDKFTGSAKADMFIYTKGKDILQDFNIGDATDLISLSGGNNISLESAKITANKKSIKFKFGSKDVLTVKPTKGDELSGELTINGEKRTYGKNSIADDAGNVTLTSKFGGTYNVSKSGGSTIDGSLVEKKLTVKGTEAAETILGGDNANSKTMFKGGGGADSLVGGAGADTFFYAKGDKDSVTIANFDFTKDKLKIAGGTLAKVSVVGGNVQFAMKEGRGESPAVGWFNVETANANNVIIKANNTYYWFADGNETLASDETSSVAAGALITSVSKISSSQIKGYDVIELNYSTNLIKSNVAVQVKDTLKAK